MKLKRIFLLVLLTSLLIPSLSLANNVESENQLDKLIIKHDLQKVDKVPEGIIPIKVESLEELDILLENFEKNYNDNIVNNDIIIDETHLNPIDNRNLSSLPPIIGGKDTHLTTVVEINDIRAKLNSEVGYVFDYYFDRPMMERAIFRDVTYHDVYITGIYANTEWEPTGVNAEISADRHRIDVNVRGVLKYYLEVPGGEFVLRTKRVNENYGIMKY